MNWIKIKEKHALTYLWDDHTVIFNDRDLYDFFDDQGVVINVWAAIEVKGLWNVDIMIHSPNSKSQHDYRCIVEQETEGTERREAEEVSFPKAFEILESV